MSNPWLFSVGGKQHPEFGYFMPTIRTALLLIAGVNNTSRNKITENYLMPESILFRKNILKRLHEDPFLDDAFILEHLSFSTSPHFVLVHYTVA